VLCLQPSNISRAEIVLARVLTFRSHFGLFILVTTERVTALFVAAGHPELVQGFNTFLPNPIEGQEPELGVGTTDARRYLDTMKKALVHPSSARFLDIMGKYVAS
jgi:histone deacetylase complex regulatory component SIN3